MSSDWGIFLLLFMIFAAWLRIEIKNRSTSRGFGAIILGCLIFCHALIVSYSDMQFYRLLAMTVGLSIAFYGSGKVRS